MNWASRILWTVYLALLAVLLPHTAWAFSRFEPPTRWGTVTAWAAAFAFEAAIAALTHKLAKHIESVRGSKSRFKRRYLNAYSAGLLVAVVVSALANLAHSVEFGQPLVIFAVWGVPFGLYSVAFGGILPLTSLIFARVLSNVMDTESTEVAPNPELERAKTTVADLRRELKETEARAKDAELRANQAEQRFGAAGDLFVRLFADEKRQRILAAAERWPALPLAAIAVIAESSPSYVSEVLKEG